MSNKYNIVEVDGEKFATRNKEYWSEIAKKKFDLMLRKSKIPTDYWDIEFEDYYGLDSIFAKEKAEMYAKQCENERFHNINLYLVGSQGAQKTAIACNIAKEFILHGYKVKFVYAADLIDILLDLQGYGKSPEMKKELDEIEECDLLIVDDIFDVNKGTYWHSESGRALVISAWDQFLRRFIHKDKRLVLTSNETIKNIDNKFGASIYDLIYRNFEELHFVDYVSDRRKERYDGLWGELEEKEGEDNEEGTMV